MAGGAFGLLGRRFPWYRLTTRLGLVNLAVLRRQLHRDNLVDRNPRLRRVEVRQPTPHTPPRNGCNATRAARNNDCRSRDGILGSPFGRNMPVDRNQSDVPDPRDVSDLLLARATLPPANAR